MGAASYAPAARRQRRYAGWRGPDGTVSSTRPDWVRLRVVSTAGSRCQWPAPSRASQTVRALWCGRSSAGGGSSTVTVTLSGTPAGGGSLSVRRRAEPGRGSGPNAANGSPRRHRSVSWVSPDPSTASIRTSLVSITCTG